MLNNKKKTFQEYFNYAMKANNALFLCKSTYEFTYGLVYLRIGNFCGPGGREQIDNYCTRNYG